MLKAKLGGSGLSFEGRGKQLVRHDFDSLLRFKRGYSIKFKETWLSTR